MRIIVVFENRTSTLLFSKDLKSMHVPTMVVNTPRAIATSCGISVELDEKYLRAVEILISKHNYPSFRGVYKIIRYLRNTRYVRI